MGGGLGEGQTLECDENLEGVDTVVPSCVYREEKYQTSTTCRAVPCTPTQADLT